MSNIDDLGLGDVLGDAPAAAAPVEGQSAVEAANAAAAAEKVKREQIDVGAGEDGFEDLIPEVKRGGGFAQRESKFGFDTLVAPVAKEDGSGYRYATKTFTVQEGVDPKKHQSSINSAVSNFNRENEGVKLITRSKLDENKALIAVTVFRVDATLDAPAA